MEWSVQARQVRIAVLGAAVAGVLVSGCGATHHATHSAALAGHLRPHKIIEPDVLLARATKGSPNHGADGLEAPAISAADEQVAQRAQPRAYVDDARVLHERSVAKAMPLRLAPADVRGGRRGAQRLALSSTWQPLGPVVGNVAPFWATYLAFSGRQQTVSGRVTAMAVDPHCSDAGNCEVWVGAAGGGIWRTMDGLATNPTWMSVSNGLPTNAIGSLIIDPTDPTSQTLYAGTGEGNESSDSEAGLGLYKSTDGGDHWALVPASFAVAKDRSIDAIAIDPTNPRHIYLGTSIGRHQSSANRGGPSITVPPGAPTLGLYESLDGGSTFSLVFSKPADTRPPISGRGGINEIAVDPSDPETVYVGMFSYGLWRRSARLEHDTSFHQLFAPTGQPPTDPTILYDDRTSFALTRLPNHHTRVYVGDGWDQYPTGGDASFWRVDNADVPASSLTDGTPSNPGWTKLTSSTNGAPGFATLDYCGGQCDYDNVVVVDPSNPDTVWIGGQTRYGELSPAVPGGFRSNGRAVMRSTDGGVHWTDMTADNRNPQYDQHPDEHAIAFDPANPNIVFIGSDGGVSRTDGQYVDASDSCMSRPFGAILTGDDLKDCRSWLSAIPHELNSINAGLNDLQFQSVSYNPANPTGNLLGGTQDNGTWNYTGSSAWTEVVGGDGGSSGFDAANPHISYSSFTYGSTNANFDSNNPLRWDEIDFPLLGSGEQSGFYKPLVADPVVGGTVFAGMQHIWRSTDNAGGQAFLDKHCSFAFGDFTTTCGDFEPLGPDLTAGPGRTGFHDLVATFARTPADRSTLWAATRYGRFYVTHNANAPAANAVTFARIDTPRTPERYPTGIAIDPANPNHAWVSFTGYNAYTPNTPGHVFDVRYNPATGIATWKDISYNILDQPVTNLAYDGRTGDLYASTDFVVLRLPAGATKWEIAAQGLPFVATYGLTIAPKARVLYAATHGRGVYRLMLP